MTSTKRQTDGVSDRRRRVLRQDLRTSELLGVPFVPVRGEAGGPEATDPESVSPAEALVRLRVEHDTRCPLCSVVEGISNTVFGEGSPEADLMFIGEAPGAEEDRTGRPFVGRAGQKLDDMILAMKMRREDAYIANILKSRPPNNRTPLPDEVAGCAPYLAEQIRIIRPTVIVTLGGPATKFILDTSVGITRLRGQWGRYLDDDLAVDVMPTFHPAYLLRNYTRETRERVWSDLQAVLERLQGD